MIRAFSHWSKIIVAVLIGALLLAAGTYFFEDLSIELHVESLERANPGQQFFYQCGTMHTLFQTIEVRLFNMPPYQPIDAAAICARLNKLKSTSTAPRQNSEPERHSVQSIMSKIEPE